MTDKNEDEPIIVDAVRVTKITAKTIQLGTIRIDYQNEKKPI